MKFVKSFYSVLPSLLSGLTLGLCVNHGYNVAFLLAICMIGIFSSLEKQTTWKGWAIHGWVFSIGALTLALLGFTWVSPVGGIIFTIAGSFLLTVPFLILYFIRQRLLTKNPWSFALLGLIWSPYTWFVKERLVAYPITLFDISLSNYPVFIQFVAITGSTGVAPWVIIFNVFVFILYKAFVKKEPSNVFQNNGLVKHVAGMVIWFSLPLFYAWYAYSVLPNSFQGHIKAAVIQPGFHDPELDFDNEEDRLAMFNVSVSLSDSAVVNDKPDILVWPEGELPFPIRSDVYGLQLISDRVLRWQTPLATGISDLVPTPRPTPPLQRRLDRDFYLYNAVAMITPQLAWRVLMENQHVQALNVYRKVNLMPFTEFVPYSDRYPWLTRFAMEYGENMHLSRGESSSPLAFVTRDERIVYSLPYICWDILFASTHTSENLERAQFITAHISGRLFGRDLKTSIIGIKNYTRLRSVEARKSIVSSSTTGHSFFTNPFGEAYGTVDLYLAGYSVQEVPLNQTMSFYHRYPNGFPALCLLSLILITFYPTKNVPNNRINRKNRKN